MMLSDTVTFRDGPTVQTVVIDWLLDAELRGIKLVVDEANVFRPLRGSTRPTDDDRVFLRANREHVAAILRYMASGPACTCPDRLSSACPWHGPAQPSLLGAACPCGEVQP